MKSIIHPSVTIKKVIKIEDDATLETDDTLAIEDPLEISLSVLESNPSITNKNISITMRTPGNDTELALGFLFTEGIIFSEKQVDKVTQEKSKIHIWLNNSETIDLSKIERHFYTSSSCGVCGKSSIDAIKVVSRLQKQSENFTVDKELIKKLPDLARKEQQVFDKTGGLHAATLFDTEGNLLLLKEDVGRHNALDKLIGAAFQKNKLPLDHHLLMLSGRVSFELIQKAVMAGIRFVLAVGAPSSLAVELANEFDITLIGFVNNHRYNIYTGSHRIQAL